VDNGKSFLQTLLTSDVPYLQSKSYELNRQIEDEQN